MTDITAWRITKTRYVNTAFDGEGARRYPGRWNSRGTPMVYAASTQSLAMLEMLVHLEQEDILHAHYALIPVMFSHTQVLVVEPGDLPADWRDLLPSGASRGLGDRWSREAASLVLAVPSVVVPAEQNYLINPLHPEVSSLRIGEPEPLVFDRRLLG